MAEPVGTQAAGPSMAELARLRAQILAVAARHARSHGYFDIDIDLVWSVAQNDLPKLGAQVRAIVGELS
jgi:uncharacterized protein with HEPN domain